ncbi:DNA polymerase III subunit chi [Pseudofulvimonas gallinarii]|jgi:DNA polymerase-3 subunit chi|uniref:DNA polymerase III chi subunit n=1 Tax=Pseudofulvimonas gallinarii TaxID=634155 RepID=A0A4V2UWN8_9GAMM|nr:DNA polymerase III subunit chi [Pseudofulvimonas gallinarii]TCT00358.1 DNA polymerase III chi subunit [Pseudofulvimonas gallinarii]THD14196.1 hypothetical protein B1808_04990 [Pseudofulvimonas gallinarii]
MAQTRVEFHEGADAVTTAVDLVAAVAAEGGDALVLAADPAQAQALDGRLWDVGADVFVPHALADDPDVAAARVVVAAPGHPVAPCTVVLNLRQDAVEVPCSRIIELIPADEAGKAAARARWRSYQARGLKPEKR